MSTSQSSQPGQPQLTAQPAELQAAARALVETGLAGARAMGRADREEAQQLALERIDRPETLIAVIGEFKQGKSSLVNALLGEEIAPVDDDLATATLTLFRYAAAAEVTVVRSVDGRQEREAIDPANYLAYVSEQQNRDNRLAIDMVEISVPNAFLGRGAVLVDTPGFGGLVPSYGGATLAFLRSVDAVIFVSDASAPLTRPELNFLDRAAKACPAVLIALSKTDLYPAWREIEDSGRATLEREGVDIPILPVSSVMAAIGRRRSDANALDRSRVPELIALIERAVLDGARRQASLRGLAETRITIDQVRAVSAEELAALEDPANTGARVAELARLQARLEQMRGPGSRWGQALADGFADLSGDADHEFRTVMRDITREVEDEIETGGDPGRRWDELSSALRERVGAATDRLFAQLEEGAARVGATIRDLIADEDGLDLGGSTAGGTDSRGLWSAKPLERVSIAKATDIAISGLRGTQSGVGLLNLVAGLAGFGLTTAATAGVGIVFGGKQLFDERKRHLQAKRQQARTAVRQYMDDVQFQVGKRTRDLARDLQRAQRDYFGQRLNELWRTTNDSIVVIQGAIQTEAAARDTSIEDLRQRLLQVDQFMDRLDELEAQL